MATRYWNRIQPHSLRHALELCKDYAREVKRLSVERIAELMGEESHWTVYGWLRDGSMPTRKIPAYEHVCGCDYVSRWVAASNGRMLIMIPTGKNASAQDIQALQEALSDATGQILKFAAGQTSAEDALAAIHTGMTGLAWHKVNIEKHHQPELELGENT